MKKMSGTPQDRSADCVPAPTLADDVAALRAMINALRAVSVTTRTWTDMMNTIDRIAARAPQRATALPDEGSRLRPIPTEVNTAPTALLWRHACGAAIGWRGERRPNYCPQCDGRGGSTWQALFVMPDGA
jgi:hypothetical protein